MSHADEVDPAPSIDPDDPNRFQMDLLAAINEMGPSKGLAIRDCLEERLGMTITHGRIYPNLDQLAEWELVEKHPRKHDLRSNEYELTRRGRRVLTERAEWLSGDGDE